VPGRYFGLLRFRVLNVDAIHAGRSPIHEPGLEDLLASLIGDALTPTTDYAAIRDTDVTFLPLSTPSARTAVSTHRSSKLQP